MNRLLLLIPFFAIFVVLLILELALEYRHHLKGYDTPILGAIMGGKGSDSHVSPSKASSVTGGAFGPTAEFPFRSPFLTRKAKGSSMRLWIASSSHAEHSRFPAAVVFPNKICQFMVHFQDRCEVVNASQAGLSVPENIEWIEAHAAHIQPDYALLYQLSLIIEYQQGRVLKGDVTATASKNNSIINVSHIRDFLQATSLYQHLSDYIGGNLKLEGPLKHQLPESMDDDFRQQIQAFINTCKAYNITPILSTFAASHNHKNLSEMPRTIQTNFVRYNTYLSADGWVHMVKHYNQILREMAKTQNIQIVDLAKVMDGQAQYFVDFVHFNEAGHARVAEVIGQNMEIFLLAGGRDNDL